MLAASLPSKRKQAEADKFKGFDWKTEEDAFMDGYHKHAKAANSSLTNGCAPWGQTESRSRRPASRMAS